MKDLLPRILFVVAFLLQAVLEFSNEIPTSVGHFFLIFIRVVGAMLTCYIIPLLYTLFKRIFTKRWASANQVLWIGLIIYAIAMLGGILED